MVEFRLILTQADGQATVEAVEPIPTPNEDGTYSVPTAALFAGIKPLYYGTEYQLGVRAVGASGTSLVTSAPDSVVVQPIPSAPASVSVS